MARRRLDPDTRWRIMQVEAHRTFAKNHYIAVMFGPFITKVITLCVAVLGLMALWLYVDHRLLGVAALILAAVITVGWLAVSTSRNGLQARMAARARGTQTRPGMGLGWAVAGSVMLLSATGWLSLWSPWA